jgi:signal transduction histidine kinase
MIITNFINTRFATLRSRLFGWFFTFTIFISLFIFLIFTFFYFFTFRTQVDHHLSVVLAEAQQIIGNYSTYKRDSLLTNLVGSEAMTIVLLSADGTTLLQTNSPDVALVSEHQLQQMISARKQSSEINQQVFFSVGDTRFITSKFLSNDGEGFLAVGYSTKFVNATFNNYLLIMLGFLILFLVIFISLTHWFLKKTLYPLEDIAEYARSIESSKDLSQRTAVPISNIYELKNISFALNKMLKELDTIFTNERIFFSDTAHIIKTPLAVLRAEIENMKIKQGNKKFLTKTIDQIVMLVQDLLFMSQIQSSPLLELKEVSLSNLTQDLADLAISLAQAKKIVLKTSIEKNIVLNANQNALIKAVGNIIKNAIEHTPYGGVIKIALLKDKSKQNAIIKVINSGTGIRTENLERIFERFYQENNHKKNNNFGLGLATAKLVIEKLGGTITAWSKTELGTTFTITLPI